MALVKLTDPSKTVDSPGIYSTLNNIVAYLKEHFDVFTSKHTTTGVHNDELLSKGRGKVSLPGGAPQYDYSSGIVSGIADQAVGHTRITLSTAATSTAGIHADPVIHGTGGNISVQINVVDSTHFDVFTRDAVSEALVDVTFSFAVWID